MNNQEIYMISVFLKKQTEWQFSWVKTKKTGKLKYSLIYHLEIKMWNARQSHGQQETANWIWSSTICINQNSKLLSGETLSEDTA